MSVKIDGRVGFADQTAQIKIHRVPRNVSPRAAPTEPATLAGHGSGGIIKTLVRQRGSCGRGTGGSVGRGDCEGVELEVLTVAGRGITVRAKKSDLCNGSSRERAADARAG